MPVDYEHRTLTQPELYDLEADIGETNDIAAANPEVVERLLAIAERAHDDLGDTLTKRTGSGVRAAAAWRSLSRANQSAADSLPLRKVGANQG